MLPVTSHKSRVLSVFSLVMINIIAIDSLRNLPINAEYGFAIVFFYLIASLFFLIPCALISAELATFWPKTGGAYIWVREAFGPQFGFLNVWLQWVYNIVWYPTILAFVAVNIAYLTHPALATNKPFMVTCIIGLFILATLFNSLGMRLSGLISMLGTIFGTMLPMILMIVLGAIWLCSRPSMTPIHLSTFFPNFHHLQNIAFLIVILFSLMGIEMSAVHAEEVKNPRRDYPRALLISSIFIMLSLTLSSLAIAVVVPKSQLTLLTGLNEAFGTFFVTYHMQWMLPVIEVFIILGAFACMAAWVIGPTKGLMTAALDGCAPRLFAKTNRFHAPIGVLMTQTVIVVLLSLAFILMPSVNGAYWFLSDLTAQFALLYYLTLFAAAIFLRYKFPKRDKAFVIPGGKAGIWLVGGIGFLTSFFGIVIGFIPPTDVNIGHVFYYEIALFAGLLLFCILPFIIYQLCQTKECVL